MGRRFGRSQKRQMRAEIAGYEDHVALLQGSVQRLRQDLIAKQRELTQAAYTISYYENIIERARDVLGRYWVGLPTQTIKVGELPEWERMRIPFQPRLKPSMSPTSLGETFNSELAYIEVETMKGKVHEHPYKNEVHVCFETEGGESCYAFSKEAFHHMPKTMAIETVAMKMAHFMFSKFDRYRPDPKKMKDWA